jgi:hypothetical protein
MVLASTSDFQGVAGMFTSISAIVSCLLGGALSTTVPNGEPVFGYRAATCSKDLARHDHLYFVKNGMLRRDRK